MSVGSNIQESILKAIDTMAQRRIDQLQLDKTITAIINSPVGVKNGRKIYKVEYEGGYFNATAQNKDDAYLPRMAVYVQVPQGDFSKEKFILGQASKLATDEQVSVVSATNNSFSIIGKNVIDNKTEKMGVYSYHNPTEEKENPDTLNHRFNFLYKNDKDQEENQITINNENLNLYKKNATAIMIRAEFMTKLTNEQKKKATGEYGLVFDLVFKNSAAGFGETQGKVFDHFRETTKVTKKVDGEDQELSLDTIDEELNKVLDGKSYEELTNTNGYLDKILSDIQELNRVYKNNNKVEYTFMVQDLISKYTILVQDIKRVEDGEKFRQNMQKLHQDWMDEIIGQPAKKHVSYYLSSNDMIGNPFSFSSWISQYNIFEIDLDNFLKIDSILLYKQGFIEDDIKETKWLEHEPDILVRDIQVYAMQPLSDSNSGYQLKVESQDTGSIFKVEDNEDSIIIANATLLRQYYEDLTRNSNTKFHWFEQDENIVSPMQEGYSLYAREGWKEIENENSTKLKILKKYTKARENYFKCVAEYNGEEVPIILQYDFIIYNKSRDKFVLQSDLGTDFSFGAGTPTITIYKQVENEDGTIKLEELHKEDYIRDQQYKFKWAIIDNNNQKTFLNIELEDTTIINFNNEAKTSKLLEDIKWFNGDKEVITDIGKNYATKIQYPMSNIANSASITFECYISYREENEITFSPLGKTQITLNNFEIQSVNSYRAWIENGDQVFQYDEYGNAPNVAKYKDPIEVLPLKMHLFAPNNIEVQDSNFRTKWYLPTQESLIKYDNAEVDPATGLNNLIKSNELSFNIKELYDYNALDNQIECQIEFNDQIIRTETSFNFTKVGNNGTNGTDVVAKIVPKEFRNIYLDQPFTLYVDKKNNTVFSNGDTIPETSFNLTEHLKTELYQKSQLINEENVRVRWNIAGNTSSANNKNGKHIFIEEDGLTWHNNFKDKDINFLGKINIPKEISDLIEEELLEEIPDKPEDLEDNIVKYPILEEYENDFNNYSIALNTHKKKVKTYQTKLNIYINDWNQKQEELEETIKDNENLNEEIIENIKQIIETIKNFIENLTEQYNKNKKYLEWLDLLDTDRKYNQYILKSENVYDKKSYYTFFNLPVIFYEKTVPTQESARIGINRDTYLKEIVYNADGRNPLYNHNQGLELINLPDNCAISWKACGGFTSNEDKPNFQLLLEKDNKKEKALDFGYTLNQQRIWVLPNDSFSGNETNNYIEAKIYKINKVLLKNEEDEEVREIEIKQSDFDSKIEEENLFEIYYEKMKEIKNKSKELSEELSKNLAKYDETTDETSRLKLFKEILETINLKKQEIKKYTNEWQNQIQEEFEWDFKTAQKKILQNLFRGQLVIDLLTTSDSFLKQYLVKNREHILKDEDSISYYKDTMRNNLRELILSEENFSIYYPNAEKKAFNQWKASFNQALQSLEQEILPELYILDINDNMSEEEKETIKKINTVYENRIEELKQLKEKDILNKIENNKDFINEQEQIIQEDIAKEIIDFELIATVIAPMNMSLNTFGLASLNAWDGNSVTIDEDEGYIMAPQIGAGYKDEETNLFTGAVMGQADDYSSGKEHLYTGLLGYKDGKRSFFLDAETGNATFGYPSLESDSNKIEIYNKETKKWEEIDNYNEGEIQLRPGNESKIGGWRLGRRSLYYIEDNEEIGNKYNKDYVPNSDGKIIAGTGYNKHHEKDIQEDKAGILLHSGQNPYISIKGKQLNLERDGLSMSAESYLLDNDSLEVQIDPQTPTLFTIFRHNGQDRYKDSAGKDILYPKGSRTYLAGINSRGQLVANGLQTVTKPTATTNGDTVTTFGIDTLPAFGETIENASYIGLKLEAGDNMISKIFVKNDNRKDTTLYMSGSSDKENEYKRSISIHGTSINLYAEDKDSSNNKKNLTDSYIKISKTNLSGKVGDVGFNFNRSIDNNSTNIENSIKVKNPLTIETNNTTFNLNTANQNINATGITVTNDGTYNINSSGAISIKAVKKGENNQDTLQDKDITIQSSNGKLFIGEETVGEKDAHQHWIYYKGFGGKIDNNNIFFLTSNTGQTTQLKSDAKIEINSQNKINISSLQTVNNQGGSLVSSNSIVLQTTAKTENGIDTKRQTKLMLNPRSSVNNVKNYMFYLDCGNSDDNKPIGRLYFETHQFNNLMQSEFYIGGNSQVSGGVQIDGAYFGKGVTPNSSEQDLRLDASGKNNDNGRRGVIKSDYFIATGGSEYNSQGYTFGTNDSMSGKYRDYTCVADGYNLRDLIIDCLTHAAEAKQAAKDAIDYAISVEEALNNFIKNRFNGHTHNFSVSGTTRYTANISAKEVDDHAVMNGSGLLVTYKADGGNINIDSTDIVHFSNESIINPSYGDNQGLKNMVIDIDGIGFDKTGTTSYSASGVSEGPNK